MAASYQIILLAMIFRPSLQKRFATTQEVFSADDMNLGEVQELFAGGDLLVHATVKKLYGTVYGNAIDAETLVDAQARRQRDASSVAQVASNASLPPDVLEQMRTWNASGRLYNALSTSQISPQYKGSTLYSELGYLLDGRQCKIISAASGDQWIANVQIGQGWEEKDWELLSVARQFIKKGEELQTKQKATGVASPENPYKLYLETLGGEDATQLKELVAKYGHLPNFKQKFADMTKKREGYAAELDELIAQHPQILRRLEGNQMQKWASIKQGLAQDVKLWLTNPTLRSKWIGYTELVADCPVEALLGAVVTLPTWQRSKKVDLPLLQDIAITWAQRLGQEVQQLRGRKFVVTHYIPGGDVEDKPQQCQHYCGNTSKSYADLPEASLEVLTWVGPGLAKGSMI